MEEGFPLERTGLGTKLRGLLAALDGEVQRLYDEMDTPFRPRFYPVARHLQARGRSSVGELAGQAGVSQPAMTQTIGEMRALGLVRGRRGQGVELTPAGAALCARLEPLWRAVQLAAEELDGELPAPLDETVSAALSRLAEKRFGARIRAAMERS